MIAFWKESYDKPRRCVKSGDITFLTKVRIVKAMVFLVVMYGCESWTIKKAEQPRIDPFEPWSWKRLLRVPLKARRSNQSILKEIIPEYSLEAEAPILWPPDGNSWLTGKDPDAGKGCRQKKKRVTEDEMVGWHHLFNGHELGQTPWDGEGQGSLVCSVHEAE